MGVGCCGAAWGGEVGGGVGGVALIRFLGGLGPVELYVAGKFLFQGFRHFPGMHVDVICAVFGTPLGSHFR